MTGIILRGVTLGAAAVLLLTGCSADPAPLPGAGTTTPSPSVTTPTVTPTPTPTAPTLPVAAQAGTEAGAEAFIRYFIETYNYAYATGDTAPLQLVSDGTCGFCEDTVRKIRNVLSQGQTYRGGEVTVASLAIPPYQSVQAVIANLILSQEPLEVVEGEKSISRSAVSPPFPADILVTHTTLGWRVAGVEVKV